MPLRSSSSPYTLKDEYDARKHERRVQAVEFIVIFPDVRDEGHGKTYMSV